VRPPARNLAELSAFIDRYTREFQLKDEHEQPLGTLQLSQSGPFVAGQWVTIDQTWTVGELPMQPGGGIILTVSRTARIQGRDPTGDHYVTVHSSNPEARLMLARPWGQWNSFITRRTLAFRLEGAPLQKGDQVVVTYGDKSQGSRGLRFQTRSDDQVIFPMHLDLEGKGEPLTPAWPSVTVLGAAQIQRVSAVAPSVVTPGEAFSLVVRSEDANRNLSSGKAPKYKITRNGKSWRTLGAGGNALQVINGIKLKKPGVYRFEVQSADDKLKGLSNPVWVEPEPERRIYWGDTHGHSGFAEGQGSPDGYFRFGRDVARLDFLVLSEHDVWLDDSEWKTLQALTRKYLEPGKFTTLLGYEWTAPVPYGGHHNVYFADPESRRVPAQEAIPLPELYRILRQWYANDNVLVIPHAHQAADWRQNDADLERVAEITSGHGTFEFFGNKYLQNGYRVGFIGSSDNHGGHPGYTATRNRQQGGLAAVLAQENTPHALFAALRNRSCYATTGERILIDGDINGIPMGSVMQNPGNRRIRCRASGTAPIDAIDLIKNGGVVFSRRYLDTELGTRTRVQVSFESSTEVFNGVRNPRGPRPWQGVIEIHGARLVGVEEPAFAHPQSFHLRQLGEDRLEFSLETRGRWKSLLLDLEEATASTEVKITLEAKQEIPGSPGAPDRRPEDLAAENLVFQLAELTSGPEVREFPVVQNLDRIELQLIAGDGALDQEFHYRDQDPIHKGDYYYLRVRQVDGAMAWSSPWWVEKP
jgi:hypothetical protein